MRYEIKHVETSSPLTAPRLLNIEAGSLEQAKQKWLKLNPTSRVLAVTENDPYEHTPAVGFVPFRSQLDWPDVTTQDRDEGLRWTHEQNEQAKHTTPKYQKHFAIANANGIGVFGRLTNETADGKKRTRDEQFASACVPNKTEVGTGRIVNYAVAEILYAL